MDILQSINLSIEKNGRRYVISMPVGAPYGEAYDALFEGLEYIAKLSAQAVERARNNEQ